MWKLNDFMRQHFMFILMIYASSLVGGYVFAGWLGGLLVGNVVLMGWVVRYFIQFGKLHRWLKNPKPNTIPHAHGIWGEIFETLLRQTKSRKKSKQKLANALNRLNRIAEAMPNGVILLNKSGRLEWFNQSAAQHLQLNAQTDRDGIIKDLVALAEFHQFLDSDHNQQPETQLAIENRPILISKTKIENDKLLLVTQDMSASEQLNQTRADFVANVSHELRTPLTVISGFVETLTDMPDLPRKQQQEFLALIQQENVRMLNLIKDLLILARLEHFQQDDKNKQAVNLSELVAQITQDGKALSNDKHQFILNIEADIWISGVTLDLQNALSNLVFNAVRYTPDHGSIQVILQKNQAQTHAKFSVIDTGTGIAPEHIPRLTERFYRVDRGRSRETGGTGLGLAITKHALAKHDTCLKIESELGIGSIFSVEFELLSPSSHNKQAA